MRVGVVRLGLTVVATVSLALPAAAGARAKPRHAKARAHAAIVGGSPAPAGSWPWLAFIDDHLGPALDDLCTGTVVAPNVILTAAHCAEDVTTNTLDDPSNFTVVTGSLDWTDAATRQVSAVTQLIVNPYVASTSAYGINVIGDAALLVLATPTTAPPIALAGSSDAALVQPGVAADYAGWGLTNGLDQTSAPTALQAASTVVQSALACVIYNPPFSSLAQLCTVDAPAPTTSICNGDSGGPLVAQDPGGQWVEIGIASASTGNCSPQLPDTFTRVDYIDAWAQGWIAAVAPAPAPPPVVVAPPPAVTTAPPGPTTPAGPAPIAEGKYTGTSGQRLGHVNLTVGAHGITRLHLQFNLHCSRGKHMRGPLIGTWVDVTDPFQLVEENGAWTFTARYSDTSGDHYGLTGTFPTTSSAAGTLTIHNRACSTGVVHWKASLPS